MKELLQLGSLYIFLPLSSAENKKGINTVQLCSIENHKGAITIDVVQQ